MANFRVYNPTAPEASSGAEETALGNVREARVSILDNNKQNAKAALLTLAGGLAERYGTVLAVQGHKASAGGPAKPETVDELVAKSDLVLIGSAD